MIFKVKRADESYKDTEATIRSSSCVDFVINVVLEIASYVYPYFITDKVSSVINFIGENLL